MTQSDPPALYRGVRYTYAAVVSGGSMVFTAGACPLDSEGRLVAPGNVAEQAKRSIENLITALSEAGCGIEDVVKTTVYVATTDQADLLAAWEMVEATFGSEGPPSTLLGVTVLGYRDQLIEIEAVAVRRGESRAKD